MNRRQRENDESEIPMPAQSARLPAVEIGKFHHPSAERDEKEHERGDNPMQRPRPKIEARRCRHGFALLAHAFDEKHQFDFLGFRPQFVAHIEIGAADDE